MKVLSQAGLAPIVIIVVIALLGAFFFLNSQSNLKQPIPAPIPTPETTPIFTPTPSPNPIPTAKPTAKPTTIPQVVTTNNTPPEPGYSLQNVSVDGKSFRVAIIAADLNSTKVIVDTASDSDCRDNCPVKPLAEYVSRSGAYAGINGSYFCPAEYPSCAGKTGSFDTLSTIANIVTTVKRARGGTSIELPVEKLETIKADATFRKKWLLGAAIGTGLAVAATHVLLQRR